MNRYWVRIELGLAILLVLAPLCVQAQNPDFLTSSEVDKSFLFSFRPAFGVAGCRFG